jgi:hypothetical protein
LQSFLFLCASIVNVIKYVCLIILFISLQAKAESVDYVAEHILEAPMNARYQAFPDRPTDGELSETRMQMGYLRLKGSLLKSSTLMLGLSKYSPWENKRGFMLAGFFDYSLYGGDAGVSEAEAYYIQGASLTRPVQMQVQDVSGSGYHTGLSAAFVERFTEHWTLQWGIAGEFLHVEKFKVSFFTLNQPSAFSGQINYAGDYLMATPFVSQEWKFSSEKYKKDLGLRLVVAWPLPRVGFQGEFTGGGVNESGSTKDTAHGTHIPDPYAGLGLSLADRASGWRIDLGASLFMFMTEGKIFHKGLNAPLFLSLSVPL